jgi:RNA polymerase sigma-70 factor (ECF subfamily)
LQDQTKHIKDLIKRCLNNEQTAYYEVYNSYYRVMYNTAYRILYDEVEAEDIMQESFISAFEKLESFKKESHYKKGLIPFASWLKRIVINKSINQLKKNKKYQYTRLEIVDFKTESNVDLDFIENEKVNVILKELKNLKSNYRLALTLNLIEGYDYDEISDIMNITNQNCRTLVSRAKSSLRKQINNKNYEFK